MQDFTLKQEEKKVGLLLFIGIFLIPIIFTWVLLKKGYSVQVRTIAFIWLGVNLLAIVANSNIPETIEDEPQITKQVDIPVTFFEPILGVWDYPPEMGQSKVITTDPLYFQLSPLFLKNESENEVKEEVKRAMLDGIILSFYYLAIESVEFDVIPKRATEINNDLQGVQELTKFKKTVKLSREQALALLRKHSDIKQFADAITAENGVDGPGVDRPSNSYRNLRYNPEKLDKLLKEFIQE